MCAKCNKKAKRFSLFLLLVIIAFSIYYRFKSLGIQGLSCDEYITGAVPHFINRRCYIFSFIMNSFSKLYVWISGMDFVPETILRFPSALTSIITIPVLFFLGKKLKDSFVGLVLVTIYSFSYYLIVYARDARFYSFYFLGSTLVYLFVTIILVNDFKKRTVEYSIYLLYAISMIFTIGNHQGALLLYTCSNVFLAIYIFVDQIINLHKENSHCDFKDIFIKLFMLAIPFFANLWHLYKISRGEMGTIDNVISSNDLSSTGKILSELSWDKLDLLQSPFWQLFPFHKYIFLICTIAPIFLLFYSSARKFVLYSVFVKWSTFVLLRLLPQAVVKEPLREKYILFILPLDFIILSLFTTEFISFILCKIIQYIKYIKAKFLVYTFIYSLFVFLFILSFSFYSVKKLSLCSIYNERNLEIPKIVCSLDSANQNDVIISFGHYGGLNNALNYEKRRLPVRNKWNLYIDPSSFNCIVPSKHPGYVWYVLGETTFDADEYVNEINNDGPVTIYKSHYKISDNLTNITVLTSYLLQNSSYKFGEMNSFISSAKLFNSESNLLFKFKNLNYQSKKLCENQLKNPSFNMNINGWARRIVGKDGNIICDNENGKFFVTLDGMNNSHFGIGQTVNIISGNTYRVSATARASRNFNGKLPGGYLMIRDNKRGKEDFVLFYDTSKSWTTKTVRYRAQSTGTALISLMVGYGNGPGSIDFSDVSFCKELFEQ